MSIEVKNLAEAKKQLTDDQIVRIINAYLKNREYHKVRNARLTKAYHAAIEAGIKV